MDLSHKRESRNHGNAISSLSRYKIQRKYESLWKTEKRNIKGKRGKEQQQKSCYEKNGNIRKQQWKKVNKREVHI